MPGMAGRSRYGWRWVEGDIDPRRERLELRHRGDPSRVAAMVGPPRDRTFRVCLISDDPEILEEIRKELDFYLLEVGGPNPWGYAIYHCGTASNAYSSVSWGHVVT